MTDNTLFLSQVDAWIDKALDNADQAYKGAVAEVARIANTPISQGGRMPVRTGDLMNSICITTNSGTFLGNVSVRAGIMASTALSSLVLGWNVTYAVYVEFGTAKTPTRAFARSAAAQWQTIVAQQAQRINI
ncbi:MAG: HK97 gp10 family phage protein [Gammaproteobacteria bacterium]|nr:HK97 gp10 family phage protein [Gammaproteobacteria bacterium]